MARGEAVVEAAMEAAQAAVRAAQAGWAAASEDLVEAAVVAASTAAGQAMAAEQVAARARGGWAQEAPLARKLACCALRPCVHGCAALLCCRAVSTVVLPRLNLHFEWVLNAYR